jgi:hypothetical protein
VVGPRLTRARPSGAVSGTGDRWILLDRPGGSDGWEGPIRPDPGMRCMAPPGIRAHQWSAPSGCMGGVLNCRRRANPRQRAQRAVAPRAGCPGRGCLSHQVGPTRVCQRRHHPGSLDTNMGVTLIWGGRSPLARRRVLRLCPERIPGRVQNQAHGRTPSRTPREGVPL